MKEQIQTAAIKLRLRVKGGVCDIYIYGKTEDF